MGTFSDGTFIVVFINSVIGCRIFGQKFHSNGEKSGAKFRISTYIEEDQLDPHVGTFNDGTFIVVWLSCNQKGIYWYIFGQRFNANCTKLGPVFQINKHSTFLWFSVDIRTFNDGAFIVAWQGGHNKRGEGHDGQIYVKKFDSEGDETGPDSQINSYTANDQRHPSAGTFKDSTGVFVWQSYDQDGSGWGIFGQRLDSNRAKIGYEFPINNDIIGNQVFPKVGTFINGLFIVIWLGPSNSSSYCEVRGQKFQMLATSDEVLPTLYYPSGSLSTTPALETKLLSNNALNYQNATDGAFINLANYTGVVSVMGSPYSDTIIGNDANNKIDSGGGNDTLTGGQGADTFVISRMAGIVTITDFNATSLSEEKIDLSAYDTIKKFDDLNIINGTIIIDKDHQIIMQNVDLSDLQPEHFVLNTDTEEEILPILSTSLTDEDATIVTKNTISLTQDTTDLTKSVTDLIDETTDTKSECNMWLWIIVIAGVVCSCCCFCFFYYRHHKHKKMNEVSDVTFHPDGVPDDLENPEDKIEEQYPSPPLGGEESQFQVQLHLHLHRKRQVPSTFEARVKEADKKRFVPESLQVELEPTPSQIPPEETSPSQTPPEEKEHLPGALPDDTP